MIVDFRVQPPWGGFVDTYFYRPRPPVYDTLTSSPFAVGRPAMPSFDERSIARFMTEMDAAGIDMAVVMGQAAAPPYNTVPNDEIAALLAAYPGRFAGFAGIDTGDPEAAVREANRAITQLGLHGVHLVTGWGDPARHEDDPALTDLYRCCAELGVPVAVTSSHMVGPDLSWANPVHVQRVAFAHPDLTLIVAHASWPWVTQACAVAIRCRNVFLMPEFYMYMPDMPGALDYVRGANWALGDRFLYSSCYPTRPLDQSLADFRALPLRPDVQEKMLGANAARLLGL